VDTFGFDKDRDWGIRAYEVRWFWNAALPQGEELVVDQAELGVQRSPGRVGSEGEAAFWAGAQDGKAGW
jgi:hypothetical protein